MDSMAPELLKHILSYLPISSLRLCRCVNRTFSILTFSYLFSNIPQWLDPDKSVQLLVSLAHDAFNRPAVIWSPWATVPDIHVEMVWLQIVWKTFKGGVFTEGGSPEGLTAENFARLSGLVLALQILLEEACTSGGTKKPTAVMINSYGNARNDLSMSNQTSHNEEFYEDPKWRCYSIIPLCFSLLLKVFPKYQVATCLFQAISIVGVQEYSDLLPPPEGSGHIWDIPHTSLTVNPVSKTGSAAKIVARQRKT
ncbi:hypothetical protein EYC84_001147 [Monilinia fructicola]|uniref:F-box domain-containing protein n=1 Tax=Monilinia fructicola TaxID=38448 RepID=A0A5M9JJ88_MONFR|nr:hypothetical protein EYC84_001147 [Monilinia fructicola]